MAKTNIGAAISAAASGAVLEAAKAAEEAKKAAEAAKMAEEAAAAEAKKAEAVTALNGNISTCESEIARCSSANAALQKDIEDLIEAKRYFLEMQTSFDSSVQNSISRVFNLSSIVEVAGSIFTGAFFSNKSDELFRGPACRQAQQAIENALAKIKTKIDQLQQEIDNNSRLISSLAQKQAEYRNQIAVIQAG